MTDAARRKDEREAAAGDREKALAVGRDRCRSGQCCAHAPAAGSPPAVPHLPKLWYENDDGQRWVYSEGGLPGDQPAGFVYHHSRFPAQLTHSVSRITQAVEVDACIHPEEYVITTYGWIDGIHGRRCRSCQGTQSGPTDQPWPEEWDAQGSTNMVSGNQGYSTDIVAELVKHGIDVSDAIMFSALACERCMNVSAWDLGLAWGYTADSEEAKAAGTTCEICTPEVYVQSPTEPTHD